MTVRGATPLALALLGLAGALLGAPAPAVARGGLVASDPPDQAVLATGPRGVQLTFSEPLAPGASHVSVVDGTEAAATAGPPVVEDRGLWQPVAVARPGDVTVTYHVEFAGGGQTRGVLRFSVGTGEPPAPAGAAPAAPHAHGVDPVGAFLLAVDGLVALGVVALLWLRRPVPPR